MSVNLQNTAIAIQMPGDPIASTAIFEAIGDHRRATATEGPVIIAGISPKPGRLSRSGSGRECGQRRLVSEDTLSLLDLGEDVVGQDIKFKAEPTHPLSHQFPVKLDLVAGIDCLLPIERKAIGILRDGDLRKKRFRRNARLDNVRGCGGLNDAVFIFEGILRSACDDDAELRRHDVKSLRDVFSDQHLLFADVFGQFIRLDYHFDPLKMRSKTLARSRRTLFSMGGTLVHLGSDRRDAGLDFLKDKGLLLIIDACRAELFRSPAETGTIEGFQDLGQSFDAFISIGVSGFQVCDLALKSIGVRCLLGHGKDHGFQGLYIIRELQIGRRHDVYQSIFCSGFPALSGG
jgi:hypothetical protein